MGLFLQFVAEQFLYGLADAPVKLLPGSEQDGAVSRITGQVVPEAVFPIPAGGWPPE